MTNPKTNQIAAHIGHDVVAFGMPAVTIENSNITRVPSFTIMSADGCDEGAYFPAQSIQIYGEDAVRQLRDFCDEILEPKEKPMKE